MFVLELAGGIWSSSLALLSDSLHVLFDATALGLSYAAIVLAARPASDRHSYGLHRGEILASLINGLTVALIAAWIFYEAWERLANPREVRVGGMMAVAFAGLVANAIVAWLLHGHHDDDLNMRGAYLHVIGDLLASVAVIAGGAIIWATGWTLVDPILGFAIGLLLLWGAGRLVRESLHILMEGVPAGLTVEGVAAAVLVRAGGRRPAPGAHLEPLLAHPGAVGAPRRRRGRRPRGPGGARRREHAAARALRHHAHDAAVRVPRLRDGRPILHSRPPGRTARRATLTPAPLRPLALGP